MSLHARLVRCDHIQLNAGIVLKNARLIIIAPDVHVSQSKENHFRDYARNRDFTGQGAEFVKVEWGSKK